MMNPHIVDLTELTKARCTINTNGSIGRLKDYEKKNNIGKIYYDVTDGKFKRLRRTEEGFSYEIIDIETFDKSADDAAKTPKESYPGEFSDNPAYRRPPKPGFTIKEKEAFDIDDPSA